MKTVLRYLCLGLAVILTAASMTLLTVRQQILKPETYLYPLNQAGVYAAAEEILTTKATAYISEAAKNWITELQGRVNPQTQRGAMLEPLVFWYVNTLIDQQTPTLVGQVTKDLKMGLALEAGMTRGVTYGVDWLAGKQADPKFLAYIPEPDKLETVQAQGVVPFVVQQWKQEVGVGDLPPCSNLNQATQNLRNVVAGNFDQITCNSPEIRAAMEKTGQIIQPKLEQTQLAVSVNELLEKYQLKSLANDVFTAFLEVSRFKQELMGLRSDLVKIQGQAQKALAVSLVFLGLGLILTPKNRMRTLFYTYVWVGAMMLLGGILYVQVATREVAQAIPDQLVRITDPAISAMQNQRLAGSIEMAVTLMVKEIAVPVKFLGGAIMILAALGLMITGMLANNRKKRDLAREQQPELFDEIPPEANGEEAEPQPAVKAKAKKKNKKTKTKNKD